MQPLFYESGGVYYRRVPGGVIVEDDRAAVQAYFRLLEIERAAKAYLDAYDSPFGGRALQSHDEWLILCSDARAALRKALEAP